MKYISLQGLLIGLATGLLSGLMGVGGGIIAVPAMVWFLSVSQHKAHGTSLGMMVLTATAAGISYALHGTIDWLLCVVLMCGTVSGAYFGARLMARVPARQLRTGFGAFIFVVGWWMFLGPAVAAQGAFRLEPVSVVIALAIGLFAGVLSGLLGIGGGVVMVPAMGYLLGIDQHIAQGVSLIVIVPTAITGALTHYQRGNVLVNLAVSLGVAAIAGSLIGSEISHQLDGEVLRRGFGIFVVATATRMLWGEIAQRRKARANA